MFENLGNMASLGLFLALGIGAIFIILPLIISAEGEEGKIEEKRSMKGGGKWVKVVFRTHRGKKKTFVVDEKQGQYIFPGERGVLKKKVFRGTTYASIHTGLQAKGVGSARFVFQWLGLYGFCVLGVVLAYFFYYEEVQAYWTQHVVQPIWKKKTTSHRPQKLSIKDFSPIKNNPIQKSAKKKISRKKALRGVALWISQLEDPLFSPQAYKKLLANQKKAHQKILALLSSRRLGDLSKVQALRLVGKWKIKKAVPLIMGYLNSSNESVVFWADHSLQKITGKKSFLSDTTSARERKKALEQWKQWFKKQTKKDHPK